MRWGFCFPAPPFVCDHGPMQSLSFPPLCLSVPYFIGQEGYWCVWGERGSLLPRSLLYVSPHPDRSVWLSLPKIWGCAESGLPLARWT